MTSRPLAFIILATVLILGGQQAHNAAIRATVWVCIRSILHGFWIH